MKKKLITLVAGTRPNFMKVAPLIRSIKKHDNYFNYRLVNTKQHKSNNMNKIFFKDLNIPKPDAILDIKNLTNINNIAQIMVAFEKDCIAHMPDIIIVVGDVDSTLACALVARKLNITLAHVEAGLRSGDLTMPEEINRIITDSISDYCFATEQDAVNQLLNEGKDKKSIFLSGDVMIDNLFYQLKKINNQNLKIDKLKKKYPEYAILTLHRPSNVDYNKNLTKILNLINKLSEKIIIYFPIHPRTKKQLSKIKLDINKNVKLINPLPYNDFLSLLKDSKIVLTDSGGLQIETSALNIPCITIRENTERPMTLKHGTNNLVGLNPNKILKIFEKKVNLNKNRTKNKSFKVWDGKSSERIIQTLKKLI